MNLRRHVVSQPLSMQLAPMIDVILFLLAFFLLTWNLARYETDLSVKIPTARNAQDPKQLPGEIVVNVRADGSIWLNQRALSPAELEKILKGITASYPDQALVLRADESTNYRAVVTVLDAARAADLWNIAFATARQDAAASPRP